MYLSKYGAARHLYLPVIKRGVVDYAVSADWTPAAGDVKISKDGGAAANVTNLPTAITMGNTAMWDFSLTATEMQAAQVMISVADSATKAVEDQFFVIETYGNASAQHAVDLSDGVRAGLTALPNAAAEAAGGLYTRGSGAGQINQPSNGKIDTNLVQIAGAAVSTTTAQLGVNVVQAGATAWGSGAITAGSIAADAITAGKIAADAIGASELATDAVTEIVTAVWAAATRSLTVLDEDTTTLDLDATIRAALGMGSADLDAQLDAIAALFATLPNAAADALLDRASGVETGFTVRQALRAISAVLVGKASGMDTFTAVFRDVNDTKDRVVGTVDGSGNRSSVGLDLT